MEVLHRLPDLLEVGKSLFRTAAHQEGDKFLAAVAGEKVRTALKIGGRRLGHGGNHLVPGGMPECVVEPFEMVNIKHADRERHLEAGGLVPLDHAVAVMLPSVGDPGQLIGPGLVLHLPTVVVQFDVRTDPGLYDQRREGLRDIVHRAQHQPVLFVLNIGKAGNQNNWDALGMLTLYHQIRDSSGENVLGVCSISIDGERLVQVMENANITSNGLVYLVNAEGEGAVSSNADLFERIGEQASFLLTKGEQAWESVRVGRTVYYADREPIEDTGWQLVALIPESEYNGQFRGLVLSAAVAVVVMMIMIMGASYFLSNYYVGRLKKLSMEMQHLQEGDLNVQLPSIQQGDEVEEVYRNFNFMVGEVRRLLREHFQLGKDARVAELRVLQAQINPHFLYNTLDLINWIAMDYEAEDIEKIAWNLARFYRLSLNHGKDLISIGEEVEHVQVYVNIQKFHYDDAVHLKVEVPEELRSLACLNIILQPFVENAILHGIGERTEIRQCSIVIRVARQGDDILFMVQDDGPGMTQQQMEEAIACNIDQIKGGYGVKNINFRIKLCFGEEYGVRYESVLGEGTTAFVLIPAMTIEEAEEKVM